MSKKLSVAERAVQAAVEEQTKGLRAEVDAACRRIARLESVLRGISQSALAAVGEAVHVSLPPPPLPVVVEPEIPVGPAVELSPEDNMGAGRWV